MVFKETVWHALVDVARRRRTKPEILAEQAVADFLERVADEDLLADSETAARKTGLTVGEAEERLRAMRSKGKR
ncbi:MAG: hypothetical protein U0793_26615 [Gemmataceae bacterium]